MGKREIHAQQDGFSIVGIRDLLPDSASYAEKYDAMVGEDPFA